MALAIAPQSPTLMSTKNGDQFDAVCSVSPSLGARYRRCPIWRSEERRGISVLQQKFQKEFVCIMLDMTSCHHHAEDGAVPLRVLKVVQRPREARNDGCEEFRRLRFNLEE